MFYNKLCIDPELFFFLFFVKMKKIFILITLFSLCFITTFYANDASGYESRIAEYADILSGFYPLSEGDKKEQQLFSYLQKHFEGSGLNFQIDDLNNIETAHSFSKNLVVSIPGKREDTLIFILPVTANHGYHNLALFMELLSYFETEPPSVSLKVLFTGSDTSDREPLGSMNFLESYNFQNNTAVVYFKPDLSVEMILIKGDAKGNNAPGWLMKGFAASAFQSSVSYEFNVNSMLLNKAGLQQESHPISFFMEEGIPALAVESREDSTNLINISPMYYPYFSLLISFINNFTDGIPVNWENNYLIFSLPDGNYYYLGEITILTILLFLFSLSIIIPVFQERRIYLNYKKFRFQLWTIPVIMFLTFQFSMLSSLVIEEILVYRNFPELPSQYPIAFFLFKSSLILFFSRFLLNLLKGIPFPKNPHFYSYMAFLFAFINFVLSTLINILFSPFALWILLMVIFMIASRRKGYKLLFFYSSLLPLLILALSVYQSHSSNLYNFLLTSRVRGNFVITMISLPVTSMITSLSFYHHHYEKSRREIRSAIGIVGWAVAALVFSYHILHLEPYNQETPQKVVMNDLQFLDSGIREIRIQSKSSIGSGRLVLFEETIPINNAGTEFKILGEIEKNLLVVSSETDTFLDRRVVKIKLSAFKGPEKISFKVHSEEPIVFYDCQFPYEIAPDELSAEVFIGQNPPNPLTVSMIFSKSSKPSFMIDLFYSDTPYSLILDKKNLSIETKMQLRKEISFLSLTDVK